MSLAAIQARLVRLRDSGPELGWDAFFDAVDAAIDGVIAHAASAPDDPAARECVAVVEYLRDVGAMWLGYRKRLGPQRGDAEFLEDWRAALEEERQQRAQAFAQRALAAAARVEGGRG